MEVIQAPTSRELLAIIALLFEENDELRERIGNCNIRFTKRVFSKEAIDRGALYQAIATAQAGGSITIKLES